MNLRLTPIAVLLYGVSTLLAMAPMSIGAGLVVIALLVDCKGWEGLRRALGKEWNLPSSKTFLNLSLFLFFFCALSLVVAHFFPLVVGGKIVKVEFARDLQKAWYLFWPFVLVVGLRFCSSEERKRVFGAWLLAALLLSVLGVLQVFTGYPQVQYVPNFGNTIHHATMFLGHHLSVASIFIFPFFAALEGALRPTPPFRRPFLMSVAALSFLCLIATFSRALWFSLPLAVFLFGMFRFKARGRLILIGILLIGGFTLSKLNWVSERLIQIDGKSTRLELWEAHTFLFQSRPLMGAGWKMGQEYSGYYLIAKHPEAQGVFAGHAHNNVLEMLGGTGILGTLAWLLWVGFGFRELFREKKALVESQDKNSLIFPIAWISAWAAFQLNGLTQVNFWEGKCLHALCFSLAWILFWRGERCLKS